jgi:hypothetical protein
VGTYLYDVRNFAVNCLMSSSFSQSLPANLSLSFVKNFGSKVWKMVSGLNKEM